ncbi:5' nucleotidase, NT5C type [Clostridium niameyense]|uniref:5' nucleotidase, NT5C type n=1 Tax=Clostridium niameyense TaxID=1622073 RepID=UPI00067F36B0|nr:nucleotidase [Clostridium niameyense]
MDKLNICIDIDGTVTEPYYWLNIFNKHFKKNIKPSEVTKYNIDEVMGITEEQYNEFYEKHKVRIHTVEEKVRKDAKDVLNILKEYNNIYFVTARDKSLEMLTRCYLENNGINYNELYVLGSHYKVKKAIELKCDIFIEDNPNNALELSEAGFKVILIDTNYNKNIHGYNIIRVYNWREVYNIVKEIYMEDKAI